MDKVFTAMHISTTHLFFLDLVLYHIRLVRNIYNTVNTY